MLMLQGCLQPKLELFPPLLQFVASADPQVLSGEVAKERQLDCKAVEITVSLRDAEGIAAALPNNMDSEVGDAIC